MAKVKAPGLTSADVLACLRTRFEVSGRSVLVEQLADSTGHDCSSWIDAAVVNLWPSDGLSIDAYEVKVSRSDFLREIQRPGKNQWCRDQLSSFSFVVSDAAIAKIDELPEGAGLLVVNGDSVKTIRAAKHTNRPVFSAGIAAALARALKKTNSADDTRIRAELLKGDPEYQAALRWKAVGEEFLRQRGAVGHHLDRTSESLVEAFKKAGMSRDDEELRSRVTRRLDGFQHQMLNLFENFAEIASISLAETDAVGKALIDAYGGNEDTARSRFAAKRTAKEKLDQQEQREFVDAVAAAKRADRDRLLPDPGLEADSEDCDTSLDALEFKNLVWRKPKSKEPDVGMCDKHGSYRLQIGCAECLDEVLALPATTNPLQAFERPLQAIKCSTCGGDPADCSCPPTEV